MNALVSQCICLQDEIQADFVGAESDVHGSGTDGAFLTRGDTVNAELTGNTVVMATSHSEEGQHISCRSSAGRCLIIHPVARTSSPVISIIYYTSKIPVWSASAFSE